MGVSWIPVLFFTLVWGIVAGILPFVIPRSPHKGVIQVSHLKGQRRENRIYYIVAGILPFVISRNTHKGVIQVRHF